MEIKQALLAYGLNEKEVKIYLSALELGRARGQEIAKRARLPRSTGYSILDELAHRGFIVEFKDKKVREFSAEDPSKIVDKSQEVYRSLKAAQPELMRIFRNAENRPRIRYYDGLEEVKEMHEHILRLRKRGLTDYQVIISESSFLDQDRSYMENFIKRRIALGMHSRLIMEDSEDARTKQRDQTMNSEIRILDTFFEEGSKAGIYILLNTVIFIEFNKRPIAVEMESKELVSMHRMLFETIWKTLPVYNHETGKLEEK